MTLDIKEAESSAIESRVRAAYRSASRIMFAMIMSIVAEVMIGLFIAGSPEAGFVEARSLYPFYVGAVFMAFGSIAYRRAQMRRLRLEAVAGLRGVEGLIKHLFRVTIVSAAMAEVIGILAILVAVSGGEQMDVIRFGVVALVVGLFTYPRLRAWQQAADFFAAAQPGAK